MARTVPTTANHFGIMLRVHRRHRYLPYIFGTFHRLAKGRNVYISVQTDRITPQVAAELARRVKQLPPNVKLEVFECPFPLVERRERFMEALQLQYDHLRSMCPELQVGALWDDDMWLTKEGVRELRGHLDILEYDRIEIDTHFLWDSFDEINVAFPNHRQALVFRVYPGDQYPLDLVVHCPARAAVGSHKLMRNKLVNAGYMEKADREVVWEMYKKAGKIDAHTIKLVQPPKLEKLRK